MPGRRYLYFFSLVELSKQTEFLLCTIYVSFVTCELSWVNGVRAVCLHSKNKRVSFCVNKSNFRRMTRQTLRWHWINNEWRWMYPQQRCNLQNVIYLFLGHISCFNPMDIVLLLLVWPLGRSFQLDARICNAWRASLLLSKLRWQSLFVEDEEYIPVSTALSSMRLCSRLEKLSLFTLGIMFVLSFVSQRGEQPIAGSVARSVLLLNDTQANLGYVYIITVVRCLVFTCYLTCEVQTAVLWKPSRNDSNPAAG